MNYEVEFTYSAAKEFRRLPLELERRIRAAVNKLGENPRAKGTKKLSGTENFYRIRVGQYRVIYYIYAQKNLVLITRIKHRKEVYKAKKQ